MRWLDPDFPDAEWDRRLAAYRAHLAAIGPRLPADVLALAGNPNFDLHDARFVEVRLDRQSQNLTMILDGQDRQLTLRFEEATVVPDNLALLADAVGAEFAANHWHEQPTVTVVRYQEVDVVDDRYVLRLRLWPFHGFAVEFGRLSVAEAQSVPRPAGPGRFVIT